MVDDLLHRRPGYPIHISRIDKLPVRENNVVSRRSSSCDHVLIVQFIILI
jgi:hypothetical protein